jgi:putative transposase
MWKDLKLPDGRDRVVRHGHGPHRAIQTGVGPVEVRRAKVRDRGDVSAEEKIRFTSSILPKWARRTKSLDALLPVLYLRGVSTGDFQEALAALLGKDAPNLSPAVISRLTLSRVRHIESEHRVPALAMAGGTAQRARQCAGGGNPVTLSKPHISCL